MADVAAQKLLGAPSQTDWTEDPNLIVRLIKYLSVAKAAALSIAFLLCAGELSSQPVDGFCLPSEWLALATERCATSGSITASRIVTA